MSRTYLISLIFIFCIIFFGYQKADCAKHKKFIVTVLDKKTEKPVWYAQVVTTTFQNGSKISSETKTTDTDGKCKFVIDNDDSYQYNLLTTKVGYFPCPSQDANNDKVSEKILLPDNEKDVVLYLSSESNNGEASLKSKQVATNPDSVSNQIVSIKSTTDSNKTINKKTNIDFEKGLYAVISPLNLREGDGTTYKIIKQLLKGEKVQVISVSEGWAKIIMEDNKTSGYVLFNYLTKIAEETKSQEVTNNETKNGVGWGTIIVIIIIIIGIILFVLSKIGGSTESSTLSYSDTSSKYEPSTPKTVPQIPKQPPIKEQSTITTVSLDGSWFKVFDSNGKVIATKHIDVNVSLGGYSDRIIVLEEGNWFASYDPNFKRIDIKHINKGDTIINVSSNKIIIQEGSWIITYDAHFKQLNTRHK